MAVNNRLLIRNLKFCTIHVIGIIAHIDDVIVETIESEKFSVVNYCVRTTTFRCTAIILIVFHLQQGCLSGLRQIRGESVSLSRSVILCGPDGKFRRIVDHPIFKIVLYIIVQGELRASGDDAGLLSETWLSCCCGANTGSHVGTIHKIVGICSRTCHSQRIAAIGMRQQSKVIGTVVRIGYLDTHTHRTGFF